MLWNASPLFRAETDSTPTSQSWYALTSNSFSELLRSETLTLKSTEVPAAEWRLE